MIKTIDPIIDKRWDAFVMNHPESTIFHHSAWARVIQDRYNCSITYYVLENEYSEITAAAPFLWIRSPLTGNRLACLPSAEFCYPLAYREEDLRYLLTEVQEEVDNARPSFLEIRGWGEVGNPEQFGLKASPYHLTHIVNLNGDLQKVRAGMDRNGRYNLRYAEKKPINIRIGQDENDLREFYRLTKITRRRLNLLPYPYRFVKSIYDHLIVPGYGYLLFAEVMGKVVAANLYFCFKDTVFHEFNAQDHNYFEYRPNYLLVWQAIERACQESYRYYNFGRTHPENRHLAAFKKHWGSEEKRVSYYYYPEVRGVSSISKSSPMYRAYTTVNRFMPSLLLNLAGEFMFKHMG